MTLLSTRALAVLATTALVLAVVSVQRKKDDRFEQAKLHWFAGPLLWLLAFTLPPLVAGFFGYGLFSAIEEDAVERFANQYAMIGVLVGLRPIVDVALELIDHKSETLGIWLRRIRDLLAFAAAVYITVMALDVPWNWKVDALPLESRAFTIGLVILALALLYFVGQRHGAVVAVGVISLAVAGILQYFVLDFRGVPYLPSDVTALTTAAEVSEGYVFAFDARCLYVVKLVFLAIGLLSLVHPKRLKLGRDLFKRIGINLACAVLVGAVGFAAVRVPDWRPVFGFGDGWYWDERGAYERHGFLPAFVCYAQDLVVEAPDGYSDDAARADEAALAADFDAAQGKAYEQAHAQFEKEQPSIVMVMNESFTDFSIINELGVGYKGTSYVCGGLDDALQQGFVSMSAYGGGTANTEFEMLTGVSIAYVGRGKIPYAMHDFSTTDSIVGQLKRLGYATTAVHPSVPTNYQRHKVYPQMGFDEFISAWDYPEDTERYHSQIRDSATYKTILDILSKNDGPQFVFDITMANHGGYLRGTTAPEDRENLNPPGASKRTNKMLNEFIACMNASDKDLKWFIDELRKLDRPVVLLFFGDHQPSFSHVYNNLLYPDEVQDSLQHLGRCYETPYLVWANYDVAGNAQKGEERDTSSEALGSLVLSMVGAPLTDFQKATLGAHEQLAQVNARGYRDYDGTWYAPSEKSPYQELYQKLQNVNYLEFGSKF